MVGWNDASICIDDGLLSTHLLFLEDSDELEQVGMCPANLLIQTTVPSLDVVVCSGGLLKHIPHGWSITAEPRVPEVCEELLHILIICCHTFLQHVNCWAYTQDGEEGCRHQHADDFTCCTFYHIAVSQLQPCGMAIDGLAEVEETAFMLSSRELCSNGRDHSCLKVRVY